ncbi:MAG TPA: apolipoprotein N-acyltransferase [Thermoanaerobaculia bacterium]|nr:apolipoprotein N-acyltransferase [Thermoanaerobaculia bacterium]
MPPTARPGPGLPLSLLLAAVGGVLWGASFAREPRAWLPLAALVALALVLGGRRPCLAGWLFGGVGWLVALPWIVPTLTTYGLLPGWLAGLALLLLAAYLGLYQGLFAWLAAPAWRRGGWAAWLAPPAIGVVLEVARGHLLTGFPWNLAAHAWVGLPGALPLAAWVGAHGVSWLLVATGLGLGRAVATRRLDAAAWALLVPLALLPVAGRWATGEGEPVAPVPVRIVQPNIPNLVGWDPEAVERHTERLFALSRAACDRPALLVWPESAAWPFEYPRDRRLAEAVDELAAAGCPVLVNSPVADGEALYNSVLLVGEDGLVTRYDKRHLVPFGEYVPLRDRLPFLGKIARQAGDFSPASEAGLLPWRGQRLGVAICFEVIFPGEVAELVRGGATVLATVTNDAWYGDTAAPWQHLRAAQFRAAESRRPLLRAAITGVSAVIGPDGTLLATLGVGEEGSLRAEIPGRADLSPHSRAPWLVPLVALLVAAAGLAAARWPGGGRSGAAAPVVASLLANDRRNDEHVGH